MPKKSNNEVVLSGGKEVLESYIFSSATRNLSIYSERLLMCLVEMAQRQLAGANFRDGVDIGQVSIGPLGEATVEIPIRNLVGDAGTNYKKAKDAIMELMRSPYFMERPKLRGGRPVLDEEGNPQYEFFGYQLLNSCMVNVKPGVAVVEVNRETWHAILDFSKGFRKYDLEVAKRFKLASSLRLYRLLSSQKNPITYSVERLRQMWGYDKRDEEGRYVSYRETSDFVRRVIEAARRELDERSPWTFTYRCNYSMSAEENQGRRGRKSITSITFFPVKRVSTLSTDGLLKTVGPVGVLGLPVYNLLTNKLEFTRAGVENNLLLFEGARKAGMDLEAFLYEIAPSALRAQSPQGYVVNALRGRLRDRYGVTFQGSGIVLFGPEEQ